MQTLLFSFGQSSAARAGPTTTADITIEAAVAEKKDDDVPRIRIFNSRFSKAVFSGRADEAIHIEPTWAPTEPCE